MKRIIYILYGICVIVTVSFFVYLCRDFRDDVFQTREASDYEYLMNYKQNKVPKAESSVVPSEAGTEYVFEGLDVPKSGASLMFYTIHQNVEVYIDGELTYYLKSAEHNAFGKTPGNTWNIIPVFPEDTGKEIKVVLTAVYQSSEDIVPDFYFGSEASIGISILKHNLLPVVLSLIAVICGLLFILFVAFTFRNTGGDKSLMMMGMFSVNIGLWKLSDVSGMALLFPNSIALAYVPFLTLLLVIIPFVLYIKKQFTQDSWIWYIPCVASIAVIGITVALQFMDIQDMRQTLWMNHMVMGMVLVVGIAMLVRELYQVGWNSRLKVMAVCMSACLLGMAADMIVYYVSNGASMTVMGMLGFLIYIVVLGVSSIRDARRLMNIGMQAEHYEQMAYHDQLTGLYNRAAYADYVEQPEFTRKGCTLIMCDLNDLKHCNDTWGHEKGDIYIASSAGLLQEVFGKIGRCYRMGGDEFCVLLRDMPLEKCEQLIGRLKKRAKEWNQKNQEKFQIEIACGYACYDSLLDYDLGDTLRRADRMMYHEKFAMK